jgi:hypothetical protein
MVQPRTGIGGLVGLQEKKPGKVGFVERLIQAHYESDEFTTLTLNKVQSGTRMVARCAHHPQVPKEMLMSSQ